MAPSAGSVLLDGCAQFVDMIARPNLSMPAACVAVSDSGSVFESHCQQDAVAVHHDAGNVLQTSAKRDW
ncbi:hypothetical protein D3C85_1610690 [compost metagenome]